MKEYRIPDPEKKEDWAKCLVLSYKTLKGVEYDDRDWDKLNWGRCMKAANVMIKKFLTLQHANDFLERFSSDMASADLNWTLETATKHALERGERGQTTHARQRFHRAITERRTNEQNQPDRDFATGEETLDRIGIVPDLEPKTGTGE